MIKHMIKRLLAILALAVGLVFVPAAAQANSTGCHTYSPYTHYIYGVGPNGMSSMATAHFRIQTCGDATSDVDVREMYLYGSPWQGYVRANLFHPDGSYASSTAWRWMSSSYTDKPVATHVLTGTIYNVEVESGGLWIYLANLRD